MKVTLLISLCGSVLALAAAQPSKLKHHHHEHEALKRNEVMNANEVQSSSAYVVAQGVIVAGDSATSAKTNPTPPHVVEEQGRSILSVNIDNKHGVFARSKKSRTTTAGGWSFTYAPFKADGSCKSAEEIKKDFAQLGNEYSLVRIYGTSCNQVANVLEAAQKYNLKIFAGIFDINQLEQEVSSIISAANKDWSRFVTISVGNELVNSVPDDQKPAMADKVIAAIGRARSILNGAGYRGQIVTVDTLVASRAYPALCRASDYCAVNCHPFFDGGVVANEAGQFLSQQITTLAKVIPKNQKIIITETGWPWKGSNNKAAVPSLANQDKALSSIRSAFKHNKAGVILFTIYNDNWKKDNEWTFGAERFWGMKGHDAPSG